MAEYWFIDLDAERIEAYRVEAGRYGPPRILRGLERLSSPLLPALDVAVGAVPPPAEG